MYVCNGKTEDGTTALTFSSQFGSKEAVELLIKEFNAFSLQTSLPENDKKLLLSE